jgi:hypothetical protein
MLLPAHPTSTIRFFARRMMDLDATTPEAPASVELSTPLTVIV